MALLPLALHVFFVMGATSPGGVPSDVKYIRCAVCDALVTALHEHIRKTPKLSEEDIQGVIEEACNPDADAGAWMRSIDLVESGTALELKQQKEDGPCGRECDTIRLACMALLEEGWENELGEALYAKGTASSLREQACREWSSACKKAPPKLDANRPAGPTFRAFTDEERAIKDERQGKPPPPGMLAESELLRRMNVGVDPVAAVTITADAFDPWGQQAAPPPARPNSLEHSAAFIEAMPS